MQRPLYSGTVEIPDLGSKVTVYFDDYGVPHIYGQNEQDIFFVLGYLHAKERLFQMEVVRRVSAGRLSEIFGNKTLEADKFFRMLGLNRRAEESEKSFMLNTDSIWKKDMLAYLDGINDYIEKRRKRFEFLLLGIPKEKFTIKDIFLIADYMAFNFQMGFKTDPLMNGSVPEIMIDNEDKESIKIIGQWKTQKNARGCYGLSLHLISVV